MTKEKIKSIIGGVSGNIKKNFKSATLNFIFILSFISVFQAIFGAENSIAAIGLITIMLSSMMYDFTAAPVKHLFIQMGILVVMAVSACAVVNLNPIAAMPINFIVIFIILYAFTYEYMAHLYFPYIFCYLYLIFISPIKPNQLPMRILGMCAGAVCIILYQLFVGRKRVIKTTRDVLSALVDNANHCVECLLKGKGLDENPDKVREELCKLSKMVYERRKGVLNISDAGFAVIDAGRGLENLILHLYEMDGPITPVRAELLKQVSLQLSVFKGYIQRKEKTIVLCERSDFGADDNKETKQFYECLWYIHHHLLRMAEPDKKGNCRKTLLSFSFRLKTALNYSPVRVVYALRVAILLVVGTLAVQLLHLTYGRWLLFTIASVSLPYADDVGQKGKKRLIATAIGGVIGMIAYVLIPSAIGRTVVMMLSGYLSFYFTDYSATFACATVGALGGAIFAQFGWGGVGEIVAVRLIYICIGILIALVANCLIFPYKRRRATKQLWEKYNAIVAALTRICSEKKIDTQLYYNLVIQAHLQEGKLSQNACDEGIEGMGMAIEKCRQAVRAAHRKRALGEESA